MKLGWSLTIATLNRPTELLFCIRCALAQSRAPKEIVVVDASDNHDKSRAQITQAIAQSGHDIPLIYERAKNRSTARQRNEALDLSTAEVCFFIDDDSALFPTAAEQIMEIYEADLTATIPGVAGLVTHVPPPDPDSDAWGDTLTLEDQSPPPNSEKATIEKFVRTLLRADDIILPYEENWPEFPVPDSIKQLNIGTRRTMAGHSMTVRRAYALQEPFDPMLERYSSTEDTDASYRWSRSGPLITALDAHIFHPPVAGRNMNPFKLAVVQAMNPIALHRKNSSDPQRARKLMRRMLHRRVIIEFTKDLNGKDFTLPRTRGFIYALRKLDLIFDMSIDQLNQLYPQMQLAIYDK